MSYCTSCGSHIQEGQGKSCSMCYGDMSYGSDGNYERWAEKQEQIELEHRREEDEQYEQMIEDEQRYEQWVEQQEEQS